MFSVLRRETASVVQEAEPTEVSHFVLMYACSDNLMGQKTLATFDDA